MRNEVQLLRTANNKNIVRLIKDFEIEKNIYLVLEVRLLFILVLWNGCLKNG